jgi:hypothetical protein
MGSHMLTERLESADRAGHLAGGCRENAHHHHRVDEGVRAQARQSLRKYTHDSHDLDMDMHKDVYAFICMLSFREIEEFISTYS